jgi:hypothetical protein
LKSLYARQNGRVLSGVHVDLAAAIESTLSVMQGCFCLRSKSQRAPLRDVMSVVSEITASLQPKFQLSAIRRESVVNFFFLKSHFILQSVVIHLAECYGQGGLQCLGGETLSRASP